MRQIIWILLILTTQFLFGQDEKIFSTWTNGFEFYSPRQHNDSLIVFSGGTLHEGGYMFTVKILDENNYQIISDGHHDDYEPSVRNKNDIISLRQIDNENVLIVYNSKKEIQRVLIELTNQSLRELVIQNKINFELSGKYRDENKKIYTFYPNEQKATGFCEQSHYNFESEYDTPIDVITFKNDSSFYYEQTTSGLAIYKAQKHEVGDFWEKKEKIKTLTKIEWLNSTGKENLKGKYPFASTQVLIYPILSRFTKEELRIMRNEIFARHGYKFKTTELRLYFDSQDWYSGIYEDVNDKLTELEKLNVKLIKRIENK